MVDVLHTVDQGVASHIIANVLWVFAVLRAVFGGRTYEDSVKKLQEDINKWYKQIKVGSKVQGKLNVERLRTSGGWPKLKAKAAATRNLAGYALSLVQEHGKPEDARMLAVCQLLVKFYKILESESQFLWASRQSRTSRHRSTTHRHIHILGNRSEASRTEAMEVHAETSLPSTFMRVASPLAWEPSLLLVLPR